MLLIQPHQSKALVGSDCSPDALTIWGSPGRGAKSVEAISQATSNKIVGWVVRLQTAPSGRLWTTC